MCGLDQRSDPSARIHRANKKSTSSVAVVNTGSGYEKSDDAFRTICVCVRTGEPSAHICMYD